MINLEISGYIHNTHYLIFFLILLNYYILYL